MQVTFSELSDSNSYSLPSRILTENLLRDERFEVHFSDAIVKASRNALKIVEKNILRDSDFLQREFSYFGSSLTSWWARIYYMTTEYKEALLKDIKGEYLFYSGSIDIFDLVVAQHMIENGIKVIFGGGLVFVFTISELRRQMKELGCTDEHLKNIIFVKGFVDLTTDLYKILKDWKDVEITENDFTTFWDCERDYLQDMPSVLGFPGHKPYLNFKFDNLCWWRKCKFCIYDMTPRINTLKNVDPNKVIDNILKTLNRYKSNSILVTNDYLVFNDKNEKILQGLVDNFVDITLIVGGQLLRKKSYIDKINKYANRIKFGLESTDTFALNFINKGYDQEGALSIFDSIIKHMSRDISISTCVLLDIPYLTPKDFFDNIDRLCKLKENMYDASFDFSYYFGGLNIAPFLEDKIVDDKFLKTTTLDDEYLIGRSRVWNYLGTLGFDAELSKLVVSPIRRFYEDGTPMLADTKLIPEHKAKFLVRRERKLI